MLEILGDILSIFQQIYNIVFLSLTKHFNHPPDNFYKAFIKSILKSVSHNTDLALTRMCAVINYVIKFPRTLNYKYVFLDIIPLISVIM